VLIVTVVTMLTDHTSDRDSCLRGQLVGPIRNLEVGVTSNYSLNPY